MHGIALVDASLDYVNQHRMTKEMDSMEEALKQFEGRILQINANYGSLCIKLVELIELKHVLQEAAFFFDDVSGAMPG